MPVAMLEYLKKNKSYLNCTTKNSTDAFMQVGIFKKEQ